MIHIFEKIAQFKKLNFNIKETEVALNIYQKDNINKKDY